MKKMTHKNCPIEVFDEHLIVRRQSSKETQGGILLPESDKRERVGIVAEVVAAGEGRYFDNGHRQKMHVEPGDKVIVSGLAGLDLGEEIRLELGLEVDDASDLFLIRQTDLIGRVKTEPATGG